MSYKSLVGLCLERIFNEQTDENNRITWNYIKQELNERYSISVADKTLRENLRDLNMYLMEKNGDAEYSEDDSDETEAGTVKRDSGAIRYVQNGNNDAKTYYLSSDYRDYDMIELKLLADAVSSARFISKKKTSQILENISALTGPSGKSDILTRAFIVEKTENESTRNIIDRITSAIKNKHFIQFRYFDYIPQRDNDNKLIKKYRDNERKCVPLALTWNDGNYYLIAYYDKDGRDPITNFRVDRMERVKELNGKNDKAPNPQIYIEYDFGKTENINRYMKTSFSMFSGKPKKVKIQFAPCLTKVIVDRFGTDISMYPNSDGTYYVNADVRTGAGFYSWIFSFAGQMSIVSPPEACDEYAKMVRAEYERIIKA